MAGMEPRHYATDVKRYPVRSRGILLSRFGEENP